MNEMTQTIRSKTTAFTIVSKSFAIASLSYTLSLSLSVCVCVCVSLSASDDLLDKNWRSDIYRIKMLATSGLDCEPPGRRDCAA